jgi:hypothetical protein
MYVAAVILFLIPLTMIFVAWRNALPDDAKFDDQDWRFYCFRAALAFVTLAVLSSICFRISWTYNGGDPHGLMPNPGL